jgi:hypothetical protein
MAKLPDIQIRRNVPTLPSAKAAGLDSKLRRIDAVVGGVGKVADVVNTALDTEAKLNASRSVNALKRDYAEEQAQIMQEYHSDLSKDPADLGNELVRARQKLHTEASKSLSTRAKGYMNERVDAFNTAMAPVELRAVQELVNSRSKLQIDMQGQDLLAELSAKPYQLDAILEDFDDVLTISGDVLSVGERRAVTDAFRLNATNRAINGWADKGDLTAMNNYLSSDAFHKLSLDNQDKVLAHTQQLGEAVFNNETLRMSNDLVDGTVNLDHALKVLRDKADNLPGYTEYQRGEITRKVDATAADHYFTGLIARDQFNTVKQELPKRKDILTAEKHAQYLAAATQGAGQKSAVASIIAAQNIDNAVMQAQLTGVVDNTSVVAMEQLLPSLSASRAESMRLKIDHAEIMMDAAGEAHGYHNLHRTELANETARVMSPDALYDMAGADNFAARVQALTFKQKFISGIGKQRNDRPADYVMQHDTTLNAKYDTFTRDLAATDLSTEQGQAAMQTRWQTLREETLQAQEALGITTSSQSPVPQGMPIVSGAVSLINSPTTMRQEKLGALYGLTTVFGRDTSEVVAASGAAPGLVGAAALTELGRDPVPMLDGLNNIAVLKAQNVNTDDMARRFMLAGQAAGYRVPIEVWGKQKPQIEEMIFTQLAGTMPFEQLEVKKAIPDNDAYGIAFRQIMGEKASTRGGLHGQYTFTYTAADGSEVTPSTLTRQIEHLRLNGHPDALYDAEGREVSWRDAIERGWLQPDHDGQYKIDMDPAFGPPGYLVSEPGGTDPYLIDMRAVPLSSPMTPGFLDFELPFGGNR